MSAIYRNWVIHNLVGHPVSELLFWIVRPFVGLAKAERLSGEFHDLTIPDHDPGTGRG